MKKQLDIGILLICTGKYDRFVRPLVNSIREKFLTNHNVHINIFTDKVLSLSNITTFAIEHEEWPLITYHRYHIFLKQKEALSKYDYLYYLDVDMIINKRIGDEILHPLVAVYHPAFYNGGGSWCKNIKSTAYMNASDRLYYFAGGFQGGKTDAYLRACETIKRNIDIDNAKGVMAEWHDESHWNKYLSLTPHATLTPSYCMVEEIHLRKMWKIDNLVPKIIALKKNHNALR